MQVMIWLTHCWHLYEYMRICTYYQDAGWLLAAHACTGHLDGRASVPALAAHLVERCLLDRAHQGRLLSPELPVSLSRNRPGSAYAVRGQAQKLRGYFHGVRDSTQGKVNNSQATKYPYLSIVFICTCTYIHNLWFTYRYVLYTQHWQSGAPPVWIRGRVREIGQSGISSGADHFEIRWIYWWITPYNYSQLLSNFLTYSNYRSACLSVLEDSMSAPSPWVTGYQKAIKFGFVSGWDMGLFDFLRLFYDTK